MTDLTQGTSLSAALALVALALVPLALMTLTSFAKAAVVLAALRNALGAPDLPSSAVVTALALALSVYVMAPLAAEIEARLPQTPQTKAEPSLGAALGLVREPLREFLARNAGQDERAMFMELSRARGQAPRGDELSLLWASFTLHELKQAFYLGFFVYLPFLVLDLVVASALLSLGLTGLTPQAVALPFKLLLFASVDGFALVARALVLGYK
jgi:type III secretion protein R